MPVCRRPLGRSRSRPRSMLRWNRKRRRRERKRERGVEMKLSVASLGAEPSARFLDQVRLAERLGYHAFFHNDKKWAQEVYVRLGAATQVSSRIGLGISAT